MFKSFIAWLDLYVSRETPASVLKSMVGLMAFAGLLGTIFGNQAIRVGAFVVVIVFVVSVILLLLADRRELQRHHETTRELMTRYCDLFRDNRADPLILIEAWNQVIHVQPNGDVHEVITIKAVALRERVYFISLTAGSRWDQPERYRRNVKILARSLSVNNSAGPRWVVTTSWRSTRKLAAIFHLHEPIKQGEEIRFEVARIWPAKCQPMMREGAAENFTFRFSPLLGTRQVDYKIVLPVGFNAVHEPIGHLGQDVHLSIDDARDNDGRQTFTFHAANVPAGETVGIRLEANGPRP